MPASRTVIPLPGLEILIWMLRITAGLTVFVAVGTALLVGSARRRWRSALPATWQHRLAFGCVVWTFVWLVMNFPGKSALFAMIPLAIALIGFGYIAFGNGARGFANPGLFPSGASAFALFVLCLFAVVSIVRNRQEAAIREEAARAAEGRRNQDSFQALFFQSDTTVAIVGTTSTEPNDADDVWVHTVSIDGALLGSTTYQHPGNQQGFAIVTARDGSFLIAGSDQDKPCLAYAARDGTIRRHRWSAMGAVAALARSGDDQFLLGGENSGKAWIALIDEAGREKWSRQIDTRVEYAEVAAIAVVGERFVAAGSDSIFSSGAFLIGGNMTGSIEWLKTYRTEPASTFQLTHLRVAPDGTLVVLGRRGARDANADLWLLQISPEGTVLREWTFGEAPDEWPGGLVLRGNDVVVAGHRFPGVESELWLRAMNLDGRVTWERTYPNSRFGRASDIAPLPDGDLLVVGERRPEHKSDAWIARFSQHGEPVWQRTYPATLP